MSEGQVDSRPGAPLDQGEVRGEHVRPGGDSENKEGGAALQQYAQGLFFVQKYYYWHTAFYRTAGISVVYLLFPIHRDTLPGPLGTLSSFASTFLMFLEE